MTRTERATSPRAIIKDRSESRSGMDKHTPKGGAGQHNWGSLMRERDLEEAALYDEEIEEEESGGMNIPVAPLCDQAPNFFPCAVQPPRPEEPRKQSSLSVSEEERQEAVKVRKDALKKGQICCSAWTTSGR